MNVVYAALHGEPVEIRLPGPFRTLGEIMQVNAEAGQFYFTPSWLSFFDSHLPGRIYAGRLFVESVSHPVHGRLYRVQAATDEGVIVDVIEVWNNPTGPEQTHEAMMAAAAEAAVTVCRNRAVHVDDVDPATVAVTL